MAYLISVFSVYTKLEMVSFIVLGFFTCGFHMALITNHLPTQITSYGMSSDTTAAIFSVYGVATMIGAFLVGIMCSKFKMKNVL